MDTKLRLLADENLPTGTVAALRAHGYDTTWIRESSRSLPDLEVLAVARAEGRLLVTGDKDFGDLIFAQGQSAPNGVLLIRSTVGGSIELTARLLEVLATDLTWSNHFIVVSRDRVRVTPVLPP